MGDRARPPIVDKNGPSEHHANKRLELPIEDVEQQVRRAFFNIVARNQDDHLKNIGFLMNRQGRWGLDITTSDEPEREE